MVDESVHFIRNGMIGDIDQNINILSSRGIKKDSLSFAGIQPLQIDVETVVVLYIAAESRIALDYAVVGFPELAQPVVYLFPQYPARFQRYEGKGRIGYLAPAADTV